MKKYIKYIFLALFLTAVCYKACTVLTMQNIQYACIDPILSDNHKQKLLHTLIEYKNNFNSLQKCLNNDYPYLDVGFIRKSPPTHCIILKAQRPLCIVNNTDILLKSGRHVPQGTYQKYIEKELYSLHVSNTSTETYNTITEWLNDIDADILHSYGITWHHKNYISLTSRESPSVTIIVTDKTKLTDYFFKKAYAAINMAHTDKNEIHNTAYVADGRFTGQYIIYKKGGENEKWSCSS
jgi:hypothetical protein